MMDYEYAIDLLVQFVDEKVGYVLNTHWFEWDITIRTDLKHEKAHFVAINEDGMFTATFCIDFDIIHEVAYTDGDEKLQDVIINCIIDTMDLQKHYYLKSHLQFKDQ